MDIYSNYRERTRVLETYSFHKRLGEGEEEKLVEGKNLGAKLKPRI